MSAYLVDKSHIDLLVTAGAGPEFAPGSGVLSFTHGQLHRHMSGETLNEIGHALWNENNRSVNHRYNEHTPDLAYVFDRVSADVLEAVPVLEAIAGYRYQACEHRGYADSLAAAYVDALERGVIAALREEQGARRFWHFTDGHRYEVSGHRVICLSDPRP